MSYTPTEWESTDVVTATRINALETAVGEMNMSYTPNVWSDGDILSAEKMNALEQAVASGGGGSSDFSTAEVTFHTSLSEQYGILYGAIADISSQIEYPDTLMSIMALDFDIENNASYDVVLYNGNSYFTYFGNTVTVSGGATAEEFDQENGGWLVTITGDCTITIS